MCSLARAGQKPVCVTMAKDVLGSCWFNVLGAGCTVLIITALPVAEIIIGALYVHECPAAPVIPVYVTVCGTLVLLLIGLFALPKLVCAGAPGNTLWTLSVVGLNLLLVTWIIFGSYHIYSVYPPSYNNNVTDTHNGNSSSFGPALTLDNQKQTHPLVNHTWPRKTIQGMAQRKSNEPVSKWSSEHLKAPRAYCHRTVYLVAFWTTTLCHVLTGVFLVVLTCLYVCMKFSVSLVDLIYN